MPELEEVRRDVSTGLDRMQSSSEHNCIPEVTAALASIRRVVKVKRFAAQRERERERERKRDRVDKILQIPTYA